MRLLKAVLVLPGTTLILVPGAILWFANADAAAALSLGPARAAFWLGVLLAGTGITLVSWTTRLFAAQGGGTLAPWDPPQELVVFGPYRHVRKPMITGIVLILAAEAVLFGSWLLLAWLLAFFVIHAVYLLRFEEPGWNAATARIIAHTKQTCRAGYLGCDHGKASKGNQSFC